MPDPTYGPKVSKRDSGDKLSVAAGGSIDFETGSKMTANGIQAAHIADLVAISGGESPTEAEHNAVRTALNSMLAALRGAGILATS